MGVDTTQRSAQLALANRLLQQGQAQAALERCHVLLRQFPEDGEVLHFLGLGYLQLHRLTEAEQYLGRALRLAPDSPNLLNELGIVRLKREAYDEALGLFSRALELDAKHSDALYNLAATFTVLRQPDRAKGYLDRLIRVLPFSAQAHVQAADNSLALSDVEQAIRRGRKAVRLGPQHTPARLSLAESLEAGGRFKQAKFQYLSVLEREPAQFTALSRLLALKGTHIDDRHVRKAHACLQAKALPEADQAQLHLALARFYDQQKQYDQAFQHLAAGNTIKFRNHPFDSARFSEAIDRLIRTFSPEFVRSLQSPGIHSTRPVFIIGLPRSGTTLVEQILASHSRIEAGGELSTITSIAAQMSQNDVAYPEKMRELDPQARARMAMRYLDKLHAISPDAARVTDKMPFNFMHVGLISALFPGAKIIHCRRHALDTCLSCYFTTFSEHLQFASDLEALGRYYLDYQRLMDHWRTVLPAPMLEMDYERLVGDTQESVRTLLAYCDVEWEAACLQFYRTERGVRTPSRWQVRQPIYANSVGRWRPYERHLQPLAKILSPVLRQQGPRDPVTRD